jgi:hypothetical protein
VIKFDYELEIERLRRANTRLRRDKKRLLHAVQWALGERGEFNGEEPPPIAGKYRRRFYWRRELRSRAFSDNGGSDGNR